MRRQGGVGVGGSGTGGHYGGDGNQPHAYSAAAQPQPPPPPHMQMQQQQEQHHPQQQSKSDHHHNQWRWDKDGPRVQSPMSPHMFNEGQGSDASRSYYQGQRSELRMPMEKQGTYGAHSQHRGDEIDMRFEENTPLQSFEGLEQKFLDDIMKLSKEHDDAEDAEITRHMERINTINAQYQEQLVALRARHASRRDEFLRRESHTRQQQYQQVAVDHYPGSSSSLGPSDPQGYNPVNATSREQTRSYNAADNFDPFRERGRFLVNSRNHEPEPRVQYPGGRVYDTGSRYF